MQPQGTPPENYTHLEASLAPDSCAQCHTEQHKQWRESLHSHTMGPGIRWQLQLMKPEPSRACLKCHAPLTEQFALLAQEQGWTQARAAPPDYLPGDLHRKGLACAACHVRQHQRFGPSAGPNALEGTAHGGFVAHEAFSDSRFCANCHQFAEDGPRLNDKLREDTYNQWQQSRYAAEGKGCQSCHMPDRRHEWKGIHDPAMTRSAFTVTLSRSTADDGRLLASAEVANSGAGHHLPTYMVPELLLRLEHVAPSGRVSELARHILAWRPNLALTEERFDQRLPAGESVHLTGELEASSEPDGSLRLRVSVAPKYQYLVTFVDYLERNRHRLEPKTLGLLELAIQEARSAEYEFIAAEEMLETIAN
ncbi:MAG: multiheme c-type cytochrome [Gammaproteobacteria bacterium]|nr:multiheme c-type cytochrome [Gammaproteobacteria bacterium]MCW8959629.1 multiheme c-type cytochrome [Gammaproteobacteria bacterium]MCW8973537.1 multiheme c-type cytochrome [Gammaproteobacteria bacterium]